MTWIRTISGKRINLLEPTPESIDFGDIATALSNICRFAGHTPVFYSVLQHSLEVANLFASDDPAYKYALLHDAHEAVTGDIVTPVKVVINGPDSAPLRDLQCRIDSAIFRAAGLEYPMPSDIEARVFAADLFTLRRELCDIIGADPKVYEIPNTEHFTCQARITPATDLSKLRIDWLKALDL